MSLQSTIKPLLTTHNLSIGYHPKNLLFEALNLELPPGKLVCFMGPNGIGKSTMIRTLAGLQKPVAGEVIYEECSEAKESNDQPKKVAVVLTDRIYFANLTVHELVTYGRYPYLTWNLRLSEADKEIIAQSIALLRIEHLLNKKLYELSDGQLQMVMIARALAQDGSILLLDEPTAHLDLNNRVEIMNLLKKIARKSQKAILVSTHELDLALQMADYIWLTGKHKNILTGTPEDLVLNGSFDDIFQLKGFDLKTGKVKHELYRNCKIHLTGDSYTYLWTRNALERNGYEIVTSNYQFEIKIIGGENATQWELQNAKGSWQVTSLDELLRHIQLYE